jgi:hypothetical protein
MLLSRCYGWEWGVSHCVPDVYHVRSRALEPFPQGSCVGGQWCVIGSCSIIVLRSALVGPATG